MNRARPENLLPSHHLSTQWFRNTYLLKSDLREFQTQDENTFGLVSNTKHKQTNSSSFLPLLSLCFWCWCYHLLTTSGRKKALHLILFSFHSRSLLQRKLLSNTCLPETNHTEVHDRRTPQPHPRCASLPANPVPNGLWNNYLVPHSDRACSGTAGHLPLPWREGSTSCSDCTFSEQM